MPSVSMSLAATVRRNVSDFVPLPDTYAASRIA